MGAAACGGRGFNEKARVRSERPIGAGSCRQQYHQASCPPPPPSGPPCPRRGGCGTELNTAFFGTEVCGAALAPPPQ